MISATQKSCNIVYCNTSYLYTNSHLTVRCVAMFGGSKTVTFMSSHTLIFNTSANSNKGRINKFKLCVKNEWRSFTALNSLELHKSEGNECSFLLQCIPISLQINHASNGNLLLLCRLSTKKNTNFQEFSSCRMIICMFDGYCTSSYHSIEMFTRWFSIVLKNVNAGCWQQKITSISSASAFLNVIFFTHCFICIYITSWKLYRLTFDVLTRW